MLQIGQCGSCNMDQCFLCSFLYMFDGWGNFGCETQFQSWETFQNQLQSVVQCVRMTFILRVRL